MTKLKADTHSLIGMKLPALAGVVAFGLTFCSYSNPRNLSVNSGIYSESGGSRMEQSSTTGTQLPETIFKRWIHSHEEDTEEIMVFRPASYSFPRSRGRSAFEIKKDGVFILYTIAPSDGLSTIRGTWKVTEPGIIVASFDDERIKSYSIKIISCSEDILKTGKGGGQGPGARGQEPGVGGQGTEWSPRENIPGLSTDEAIQQ